MEMRVSQECFVSPDDMFLQCAHLALQSQELPLPRLCMSLMFCVCMQTDCVSVHVLSAANCGIL